MNTTSSEVTGSPSCQVASGRIVNVQVLPLASTVQPDGQVRPVRPVGAERDEAAEDERGEVAVGLGPGGQRVDRARAADRALAIDDVRGPARGSADGRRPPGRRAATVPVAGADPGSATTMARATRTPPRTATIPRSRCGQCDLASSGRSRGAARRSAQRRAVRCQADAPASTSANEASEKSTNRTSGRS